MKENHVRLKLGTALGLLVMSPPIAAAQTASVTLTHNDPDGLVTQGQTIQVTATFAWQGSPGSGFGLAAGDIRATNDLGLAANAVFPYVPNLLPALVIQPGTPSGGSLLDVYINSGDVGPSFGLPVFFPWNLRAGLVLTRFDWTAPATPGLVEFRWIPDPVLLPHICPPFAGGFQLVPTTYFATSVTVVPAPAAPLALIAGLAIARRRRR